MTDSFAAIENRGGRRFYIRCRKKRGFNVNTTTVKERRRERGRGIEEETERQAWGEGGDEKDRL